MKTIFCVILITLSREQEPSETLKGCQRHILKRMRLNEISTRVRIKGTILILQLLSF
jgi:hypothetical protein